MDISDLPAILPIIWLDSGVTFRLPSRVVEGTNDSEEVQLPKEPETPGTPVTIEPYLLLMAHE